MGSSAAATCTSAWVPTPPVIARLSSTMVMAMSFLRLRDGTHPLAAGPVNPGLLLTDDQLTPWVERGTGYARSLPPKQ